MKLEKKRIYLILFISISFFNALSYEMDKKAPKILKRPCQDFGATKLDLKDVAPFISKIKRILVKKTYEDLAPMAEYPFSFNSHKKKIKVKNIDEFNKVFKSFVNEEWAHRVIYSDAQNSACSSRGVGLYKGSLWLTAPRIHTKQHEIKITAINVF